MAKSPMRAAAFRSLNLMLRSKTTEATISSLSLLRSAHSVGILKSGCIHEATTALVKSPMLERRLVPSFPSKVEVIEVEGETTEEEVAIVEGGGVTTGIISGAAELTGAASSVDVGGPRER